MAGPVADRGVRRGHIRATSGGRCFRSVDSSSDCCPKFVAIDEEAQDQIVHRYRFGETNRATHQPLDPGPQMDVLAFDLLRLGFANRVLLGSKMALVGAPPIGVKARDAKWFS
jgi:hypothetical protein